MMKDQTYCKCYLLRLLVVVPRMSHVVQEYDADFDLLRLSGRMPVESMKRCGT